MATRDDGVAEEGREWADLCYEECGFVCEGIEREAALVDGAWYDDVMMSISSRSIGLGRGGTRDTLTEGAGLDTRRVDGYTRNSRSTRQRRSKVEGLEVPA
jgi:hypothetical protein